MLVHMKLKRPLFSGRLIVASLILAIALFFGGAVYAASTPGISQASGNVYDGDKIAVTGAVYDADDIRISIGLTASYTASEQPDQVRLNTDGTFVFVSGDTFPTGAHSYEVRAIAGSVESAPVSGNVTITNSGRPNLLSNTSYEIASGSGAANWSAHGGAWGGTAKREAIAARTDSYGVSITTATTNNPWVRQSIDGVEEGAMYEFTVWTKAVNVLTGSPGFKVEFYSSEMASPETWIQADYQYKLKTSDLTGDWQQMVYRLVAPPTAKKVELFVRFYGTGTVYFDDASIRKVRDAVPTLQLDADRLFYRPEQTSGSIKLLVSPDDEIFTGKTVDLWHYNRETGETLLEQTDIAAAAQINRSFDPSDMEMREPHHVLAVLRSNTGEVLSSTTLELHRWQRPTALTADGTLLVDDKPFYPVYMYHVPEANYTQMAAVGVNTVQGNTIRTLTAMQQQLDAAEARNLKVLVALYADGFVRQNFPFTEQVVMNFKNHPAVIGWYVIDEPNERGIEFAELVDAYKLIRSLDDKHPVFIMESKSTHYAETSKVTDVLGIDVYPLPNSPISLIGERLQDANLATDGQVPVWQALQAFRLPSPSKWNYLPTIDEVRNMVYQTVLNGAKGIGYYSFYDPGWLMSTSELWPGMQQFAAEYPLMKHLTFEADKINSGKSGDIQWGLWDDDEELYVVAAHTGNIPQTVTIPLPFAGYRTDIVAGAKGLVPSAPNGFDASVPLALNGGQAVVYKVTPLTKDLGAAYMELNDAITLISNAYWQAETAEIADLLGDAGDELNGVSPNVGTVFDQSVDSVQLLQALRAWVAGQSDAALSNKRMQLNDAIDTAANHVERVLQSAIRLKSELPDGLLAGWSNPWSFQLNNTVPRPLNNVAIAVYEPAAWSTSPLIVTIGNMNGGASAANSSSKAIAFGIAPGDYPFEIQLGYTYDGLTVQKQSEATLSLINFVDVSFYSKYALIERGDDQSFQVTLRNKTNMPQTVLFTAPATTGITFDFPTSLTLSAKSEQTIEVTASVSMLAATALHDLSIGIQVDSVVYDPIPFVVAVENGIVLNPSFEVPNAAGTAPANWNMRAGIWNNNLAHVTSGLRSARMNAAPSNSWHVIDSQSFNASAGNDYTLSAWVKNSSSAGRADIGFRFINSSGGTISYLWQPVDNQSGWKRYELTATAPANTTKIQVFFKMTQTANGTVFIDDVYVWEP